MEAHCRSINARTFDPLDNKIRSQTYVGERDFFSRSRAVTMVRDKSGVLKR